MFLRLLGAWIFVLSLTVLGVGAVSGQDYPNRPVRIVTGSVGGANDFVSRLVAQGISGPLGQPVVVENRGDGQAFVSRAAPDGYTLLVTGSGMWIGPLIQKTPYDPVKDFSPITIVGREPNVLVVHPALPVKSVKELIALAKARPAELNYAIGGIGGSTHLAGELLKSMAGVKFVNIPYSAGSVRMADLCAGQTQFTIDGAGALMQFVKSGKLRALAVTSHEPSSLYPGVPTVAASLPGYELVLPQGMLAPARTPDAFLKRLNQEVVRFLNQASVKEKFLPIGIEPVGSSQEELAATMKSDMALWGKVVRDAGIGVQ